MIIKLSLGICAVILSIILAFIAFKFYKKIQLNPRDSEGKMMPKFKNYLDFYFGIGSIIFLVVGLTILIR